MLSNTKYLAPASLPPSLQPEVYGDCLLFARVTLPGPELTPRQCIRVKPRHTHTHIHRQGDGLE